MADCCVFCDIVISCVYGDIEETSPIAERKWNTYHS